MYLIASQLSSHSPVALRHTRNVVTEYLNVAWNVISLLYDGIITPPMSLTVVRTLGPVFSNWVFPSVLARRAGAGRPGRAVCRGRRARDMSTLSMPGSLSLNTPQMVVVVGFLGTETLTIEEFSQVGWYATGFSSFWIHLKFVTKFLADNHKLRDIYDTSQDFHLERVHWDINLPLSLWPDENRWGVRVGGGGGRLYRHDLSLCFSVMTCTDELTKGRSQAA